MFCYHKIILLSLKLIVNFISLAYTVITILQWWLISVLCNIGIWWSLYIGIWWSLYICSYSGGPCISVFKVVMFYNKFS